MRRLPYNKVRPVNSFRQHIIFALNKFTPAHNRVGATAFYDHAEEILKCYSESEQVKKLSLTTSLTEGSNETKDIFLLGLIGSQDAFVAASGF